MLDAKELESLHQPQEACRNENLKSIKPPADHGIQSDAFMIEDSVQLYHGCFKRQIIYGVTDSRNLKQFPNLSQALLEHKTGCCMDGRFSRTHMR